MQHGTRTTNAQPDRRQRVTPAAASAHAACRAEAREC